jgi:hypothetical protein
MEESSLLHNYVRFLKNMKNNNMAEYNINHKHVLSDYLRCLQSISVNKTL